MAEVEDQIFFGTMSRARLDASDTINVERVTCALFRSDPSGARRDIVLQWKVEGKMQQVVLPYFQAMLVLEALRSIKHVSQEDRPASGAQRAPRTAGADGDRSGAG